MRCERNRDVPFALCACIRACSLSLYFCEIKLVRVRVTASLLCSLQPPTAPSSHEKHIVRGPVWLSGSRRLSRGLALLKSGFCGAISSLRGAGVADGAVAVCLVDRGGVAVVEWDTNAGLS